MLRVWGVRRIVPPTLNPLGTRREIEVREPAMKHAVTLAQLQQRANGVAKSPAERIKRERMRQLLNSGVSRSG